MTSKVVSLHSCNKLQGAEIPSLQVVAVSIRSVPVPQPKAPEEVLLVKDDREASTFIAHLVLLCRIQITDSVSVQEVEKQQLNVGSGPSRNCEANLRDAYPPKKASVSVRFSVHAAEFKHTLHVPGVEEEEEEECNQ